MPDIKRQRKSLLDDEGDGDVADGADLGIRVNKAYAARFEHNKRREELHRLQAKYPEEAEKLARKAAREAARAAGEELPPREDGDDDSSDDEEEDDGQIPEDTEAKIFETLLRIRRQDPAIYQKDVKFFDDAEEQEDGEGAGGEEGGKSAKRSKPMFLKDMIAKQALEYGPEASSGDEEEEGGARKRGAKARNPKVYDTEQEKLRSAFLEAAEEAEADGEEGMAGVLRLRAAGQAGGDDGDEGAEEEEDDAPKQKKKGKKGAKGKQEADGQFQQLIEAYFGSEGQLNPDDKFLKEYIVNKGWVDKDDDYVPSYREVVGEEDGEEAGGEGVDDEEDEVYLRQMDAFEANYNFRYEEPGADRIITHPRTIEGTVRKPDEKRKRQRDAKKQRLEAAEEAAREEVKRLKNLKKQEIESKLDKLRQVAGAAAPAAASLDDVLEGDFDPEEWDKKMAAAFDDAYYDVEEELEGLQEELDLLGGDSAGSSEEEEEQEESEEEDGEGGEDGGAKPVRFSTLKKKLREVDALSEEPEEGGERGGKARPDPEVAARQRAELQRLLEDYYKLDYEDNVGGVKTRFRYKEVPASTFGLSVDEILRLDDKSLNQVAGMKRLAPYREDLEKQRPNYKALQMVKGDLANVKGQRRQYKKREWQKGAGAGGRQGGQGWRGKEEPGEAAGAGPGSTAGKERREKASDKQQRQSEVEAGGEQRPERKDKKRRERPDGDGDEAGPGPGSEAAGRGEERAKKRKERSEGQHDGHAEKGHKHKHGGNGQGQGRHKPQPVDPQQARLASYAVPTLKKDSGGPYAGHAQGSKKRKRGDEGQGQKGAQKGGAAEANDGPQLTRAQKKNLKRAQKRAEKRQTGPAAVDG